MNPRPNGEVGPIDPNSVPIDLTGFRPGDFNAEAVLNQLKHVSQDEVDSVVTQLQEARIKIHDDRQFLTWVVTTFSQLIVKTAKIAVL